VYIILKGITKFSYVLCTDGDIGLNETTARKRNKLNLSYEPNGDVTLRIDTLKMKDFAKWDVNETEFLEEDGVKKAEPKPDVEIKSEILVTAHRIDLFKDMFAHLFKDQLANFHASLNPKYNRECVFKAGEGAGRSGSFFFFCHDNKFIIKTMNEGEFKMYLKRLPEFGEHYKKNKDSLLAKILGVFTVNTKYIENCHIMLMENCMQLKNKKELRYIFDLKGSMVDRKVTGDTTPGDTLKD
jgi:hypothetical protein